MPVVSPDESIPLELLTDAAAPDAAPPAHGLATGEPSNEIAAATSVSSDPSPVPERAFGRREKVVSDETRAALSSLGRGLGKDLGALGSRVSVYTAAASRDARRAAAEQAARFKDGAARVSRSVAAQAARSSHAVRQTDLSDFRAQAFERWKAGRAAIGSRFRRGDSAQHVRPGSSRRRLLLRGLAVVAVLGLLTVGGVLTWALSDVSWSTVASETTAPTMSLESADGQRLVQQGPFRGAYTPLSDFPAHVVQAVVSIEDRRFYDHPGIDMQGILRASLRNVSSGEVVQGGSTITQQLLKILHLDRERTFKRKIQEAFLALWIETRLSKQEILTRYLNNIYLGAGATGMPAAARVYFDKTVGELTIAEGALLAGLIKAPSQLNPLVNLDDAKQRAGLVLASMQDGGYLDAPAAAAAKTQLAGLHPVSPDIMRAGSWFADWVIGESREIAGPFPGSINVRTTLDPALQEIAQRIITQTLQQRGPALAASQAALVALQPNGAVVAMVGGTDYGQSQFNRATRAMRQPGSTFKLFVYYAALKAGMSPTDRILDAPIEINGWTPENYSDGYAGRVSLAEAFARSLNAATVRLAMDVGIDKVVAAARELGIDAPLTDMPSLSLGSSEVSLLDLTGAYASVRAGIAPIEPWGIAAFSTGEQGRQFTVGPSVQPKTDLGAHHRDLVALLKLVVDRGTGRAAGLDGFAAGKTGTSQNSRDAWFVGFNEDLVVGVWVGNDDGTPMDNVTGGQLPATIWKEFMTEAAEKKRPPAPQAVIRRQQPANIARNDNASNDNAAQERTDEPAQCNVRACARFYNSFRASDCSYQPYRGGPRRLCDR